MPRIINTKDNKIYVDAEQIIGITRWDANFAENIYTIVIHIKNSERICYDYEEKADRDTAFDKLVKEWKKGNE